MIRPNKKFFLIGVVAVALLLSFAAEGNAGWRHRAYWGYSYYSPYYSSCFSPCYTPCYTSCYTPCYTSCYTPCYNSCWGYGYGWRRAWRFGCSPYYSCYTPCSYVACCGATSAPAAAPAAAPAPTRAKKPVAPPAANQNLVPHPDVPPPAAPRPNTSTPTRADSGLLTIWVPFDAKVTVNDLPTSSQGSRRQFVSYGLKPGFSYKYVVRAEVVRENQVFVDKKEIVLKAGDRSALAFGFNRLPTQNLAAK